ncbi:MAG: DUF1553 domain-containing protein, partial [Armatimonadetes bacterium]|nr:DUF1553 domain-containing protein [Armatimonadota bacterium]
SQVRDNTFVRRVYLDLIGTLPTPEQIADYADDRSPKKREHLIDKLLRRPEFIYYWTQWWGDMLRVERRTMKERGVKAISRYLRTAILQNRPLDQMARELLTATGRSYDNGPVNFYSPIRRPQQAVVQFSSVFMGVRMECAQCHNHPYESWTQNDFYNLAMFFRQTRLKGGPEKDEITLEDLPKPQGLRIPNRAGNVQAQPILPGEREVARTSQNLRSVLADWITSKENPYFAQSMANRIWARLMGRGVFEPLDDYRATNPPVDRELLQVLSDLFVESGFDMRALIKQVVMSRAYSVSSEANPSNESDTKYFSRYYAKRLAAEVFVDAVCDVTGRRERYSGYDPGTRAIQLEDVNVYSRFLDVFNRPKRRIVICNRNNDPSLVQALFLMNNGAIHNKIASKEGSIANWLKVGARPQQIVDRLFTYCLGRLPRAKESETINGFLMKSRDPKPVLEDVLWALINSREFQYNH